ncbi:MAG: HPr family phosphocarrier protein [Pirellulales bacterium]
MSSVVVRTFVVRNPQGLHLRPAELLSKACQRFGAKIEIVKNHERVDAKSIFAIVTLVALEGTELTFEADGPDANDALDAVAELFAGNFGE